MCHTFEHFIHMQYFLLPTNLVTVFVHWVSTSVLYKPWQCSLFWDYIPKCKLCCGINLCRPSGPYSIHPIQKLLNCQTTTRDGEQPKTALWLWVHEMTRYLYTRGVRGQLKTKQRWFKVTRHEWFHHVHDGHWAGEFATVIWRLHCFTASFHGDVRGESDPRKLASVNWRTPQWARGQFTRVIIPDWFEKWRDIKFWYMCWLCSSLDLRCVSLVDDAQNMFN